MTASSFRCHVADVVEPPAALLGAFDAVIGFFALHHIHDLSLSLRSMSRLLVPGGRIAFLEPNPYNPLYYVQMAVKPEMTWEGDRGMLRMRPGVILPALESAGLGDCAYRRFGFFPPFLANAGGGGRAEAVLERVRPFRPMLPFQLFRGTLLSAEPEPRGQPAAPRRRSRGADRRRRPLPAERDQHGDESWFLQVVTRVAEGDVLYRDVFFGATPLSVWLTWPFVALFGPQLVWVKLMVLAAFAVTLVLTTWIVRRLGAGTSAALLVAAAVLVFATPHRSSFYPPLATSCLVACLAAVLVWVDGGPRARLGIAGAGAAAGLAFAAKQNVGLLVLAAVFVAVLLAGVGRRMASWTLAGAGFIVCALLPLIPVAATGGFSAFLDYGFTNKGTYTDLGGISYPTGFREEAVDVRGFLRAGRPSMRPCRRTTPSCTSSSRRSSCCSSSPGRGRPDSSATASR